MTFLTAILSLVVQLWCALARPTSLACPPGWNLDHGIQLDGSFRCAPDMVGDDQPPGAIYARLYCPAGTAPLVLDDARSVACSHHTSPQL